ncbi:MAG: MFS transporter [Chloroflexota bacterium]
MFKSASNLLLNKEMPNRITLSIILSVVFLDNLGYAIVFPYIFFYVKSLGGDVFIFGVLLSAYSLMSFLFTPAIARLSDRHGRRRIILFALLISGVSYIIFGVANVLWLLFLSRMLAGTTAATVPVAQAYVADVTTAKERLKYIGWTGASAGLAFITGQAIGGLLSNFFGYALPSFLAAVLAFVNLILAYFFLTDLKHSTNNLDKRAFTLSALKDLLSQRVIVFLFATYFMFFISFVFLQAVIPPWSSKLFGFSDLQVGLLFAYVGIISVLTQVFVLPRLSKKTFTTIALYGVILLGVSLLAVGIFPFLIILILMAASLALGFGLLISSLSTLISIQAPKEAQGGSLGIAWSLAALAQTIGPTLAVSLFTIGASISLDGLAFVMAAIITLMTIPLLLSMKKQENIVTES